MSITNRKSKYLQYLPALFQADKSGFTDRFLLSFEHMLSGFDTGFWEAREGSEVGVEFFIGRESIVGGTAVPGSGRYSGWGIEDLLRRMPRYFDPYTTPPAFLGHLASWLGLELRKSPEWSGLDEEEQDEFPEQLVPLEHPRRSLNRELLTKISRLYERQGTRFAITEYLALYIRHNIDPLVEVIEDDQENIYVDIPPREIAISSDFPDGEFFRIKYTTVVGRQTYVGGFAPPVEEYVYRHPFRVGETSVVGRLTFVQNFYAYLMRVWPDQPVFRIGASSRVGKAYLNTLRGADGDGGVAEPIRISVNELYRPFRLNFARVSSHTVLGGRPYYFLVEIRVPRPTNKLLGVYTRDLMGIVSREKTAHTQFSLLFHIATMRVNVYATIGTDTLLGGRVTLNGREYQNEN